MSGATRSKAAGTSGLAVLQHRHYIPRRLPPSMNEHAAPYGQTRRSCAARSLQNDSTSGQRCGERAQVAPAVPIRRTSRPDPACRRTMSMKAYSREVRQPRPDRGRCRLRRRGSDVGVAGRRRSRLRRCIGSSRTDGCHSDETSCRGWCSAGRGDARVWCRWSGSGRSHAFSVRV